MEASRSDSEDDLPTFHWAKRTAGSGHSTTAYHRIPAPCREVVLCDGSDDELCILNSHTRRHKATKFTSTTSSTSTKDAATTAVDPSTVTHVSRSCDGHFETSSQTFWSPSNQGAAGLFSQGSSSLSYETEGKRADKELRIEKKRRKAEEKRQAVEARKTEREQARAEKRRQKEMDKAVKEAAKESSKEKRPTERVKQMVVLLDTTLSENGDFMAHLASELHTLGVTYRICQDMHPGSVRWKRIINDRTVDKSAQELIEDSYTSLTFGDQSGIHLSATERDEGELLVTLEGQGLVGLVYHTKQAQHGIPLSPGAQTLQQFVEGLQQQHPGKRVTLAVEGLDAFLRSNKTRLNRKFRQAVAASGTQSAPPTAPASAPIPAFSSVTMLDCEEALVGLQLTSGCPVRQCINGEQLAEHVVTLTRAIAEAPFKRESPFSFHSDLGPGASKKAMMEADNKVGLVWQHQLMQFKNLSEHQASAIAAVYTSPAQLLQPRFQSTWTGNEAKVCEAINHNSGLAYESSPDPTLLLQDIVVRRGVGTTTSCRRVGPTLSKRVHALLTSHDPTLMLT